MKDIHGGDIWKAASISGIPAAEILDFSASINPFGLPRGAAQAVRKGLRLSGAYPEPSAHSFVKALSRFHSVHEDEISPGNGSTELIYLIPGVFKPKKALIVEPAFSEYARSLRLHGSCVEAFTLKEKDGFAFDLAGFSERLKKGYCLAYLSNPANPTGAVIPKDALREAARLCRRHSTTLVIDEAFTDFCEEASLKKEASRLNVIVLRSMTKFFSMAGLRLGFLFGPRAAVKRFTELRPPWSINTMAIGAGIAALEDRAYIEKTIRWLNNERSYLFNGLKALEAVKPYPSSANYLMARIGKKGMNAPRLRGLLSRRGILIRDLSAFKGLGPEYLRVAVRKRRDNEMLLKVLSETFSDTK